MAASAPAPENNRYCLRLVCPVYIISTLLWFAHLKSVIVIPTSWERVKIKVGTTFRKV